VGLGLSLAVSLPTGWALARRYSDGLQNVLRALPTLMSISWAILAAALLPVGLEFVYGMWIGWLPLHQFALYSVFTAGALPIGTCLLVAFFVLLNKRDRQQLDEARARTRALGDNDGSGLRTP
jgi:TRAP-type C4-dicarboxylate transport system permease small subunit